jgi:hypothetical protein
MSAVIGALRAELSASIAQFQSDMGKAADSLRGFTREAKSISKDLEEVGRKMSIAITAPLALLAKASFEQSKAAAQAIGQVEAAIQSTGGVSGKTAAELDKTAASLAKISIFEKQDILKNVTAQLLSFGNIQGPVFDKAQKAVIDLASRMGGDLEGAAIKVGRALNDPIEGITALSRVGVQFTTAEKEQIKQLVQSGNGFKAQQIILDRLTKSYGGAAEALRAASPDAQLMQEWHDFEEVIGQLESKFLPPLVTLLTSILHVFEAIPEPLQTVIVGFAGFLALVGPLLLILSPLVRIVGILTPLVVGLATAIAGLSAPVLIIVAALTAAAIAIAVFWKSIKDVFSGNWKAAWTDAKATASGIVDDILGLFKKAEQPVTIPAPKIGGGKPGKTNFDLHNQPEIAAAKTLQDQLNQASIQLQHGFDTLQLPKATADATQFNARLDEYVRKAADAGVNTKAFADQISGLRQRAAELERQGIDKEAKAFTQTVDDATLAVDKFSKGGLNPLQEKLAQVDDQYKQLKDKIQEQIDQNQALASVSKDAADAMERLKKDLGDLEVAHQKATKAANDQYHAEQGIAHLESFGRQLQAKTDIVDLQQARGATAPVSSNQRDLQAAGRQLDSMLVEAETRMQEAANKLREGENTLSDQQKDDLKKEYDLQKTLADLVQNTTAEQIVAAGKVNEAFQHFTDDLSNSLSDMIANWPGTCLSSPPSRRSRTASAACSRALRQTSFPVLMLAAALFRPGVGARSARKAPRSPSEERTA